MRPVEFVFDLVARYELRQPERIDRRFSSRVLAFPDALPGDRQQEFADDERFDVGTAAGGIGNHAPPYEWPTRTIGPETWRAHCEGRPRQKRNATAGRAYYDQRKAAGKTSMEAMRCLRRRLSNVIYRQMVDDQKRKQAAGPGGHSGTTLQSSVTDLTPNIGPSDKPHPGPARSHRKPMLLATP